MKPPCCRATLVQVREHLRFVASRVGRMDPQPTPREVLEKLAATLEAAMDVDHEGQGVDQALGRVADAVRESCPSCGGTGWASPPAGPDPSPPAGPGP